MTTSTKNIQENEFMLRGIASCTAGAMSGIIATAVTYPFDLVRTQWIVKGRPNGLRMHTHVLTQLNESGIKGIYRGIRPALYQVVPNMALAYTLYDFFKQRLLELDPTPNAQHISPLQSLMVGVASGAITKLVVYPLDTAKKRLQADGLTFEPGGSRKRQYTGVLDCFRKMLQREGVTSWYRGLRPTLLKAVLSHGIIFTTYEYVIFHITDGKDSL